MSNRCPNCNKFVGLELQEPEVDVDVQNDTVEGNVRLVLTCVECGDEGKDVDADVSLSIDHECSIEEPEGGVTFELISADAAGTDRYENKDRKGKTIKNFRYMKHYYGADITVTIQCNHCNEEFELQDTVEEQASGFNELW